MSPNNGACSKQCWGAFVLDKPWLPFSQHLRYIGSKPTKGATNWKSVGKLENVICDFFRGGPRYWIMVRLYLKPRLICWNLLRHVVFFFSRWPAFVLFEFSPFWVRRIADVFVFVGDVTWRRILHFGFWFELSCSSGNEM